MSQRQRDFVIRCSSASFSPARRIRTPAAYEYFQKAISLSPTYHRLANENLKRLDGIDN